MKKIFSILTLMLLVSFVTIAQTANVTFQVDMSVQVTNATFDPATDGVEIRGDFDGWGAGQSMTDPDGDGIYTTVITANQSTTVNYKFFHTGGGGTWESDPNRTYDVGTTDSTVPVDYFDRNSGGPVSVTFQVDMSVQVTNAAFDPATDGVEIRGDFDGWGAGQSMTDTDGDLVYTTVITADQGTTINYKFFHTANGGTWESDPNRTYDVGTSDSTVPVDFFDRDNGGAVTQVNVTFQVDMRVQEFKGMFDPTVDQVEVRGSFNGWDFGDQRFMTDDDGDSVFVVTVTADANADVNYKFFHSGGGGTWEDDPNRVFTVADVDATVPVDFFNREGIPSGDPASVTFNVDMRLPGRSGAFDPSVRSVFIAGSFTDWGTSPVVMDDSDGDSVYTVTTDINSAQIIQYKFIYANTGDTTDMQWESVDNRAQFIVDGPQTYDNFWDNVDPDANNFADGNIEFTVDMSVMTDVGVFDAAADSTQVRGGFNGWGDSDRSRAVMAQNFLNPSEWFLQIPFSQVEVGATQNWKYYVVKDDANTMWTDGWERPLSTGGGNRAVDFEGTTDQAVATSYYDDVLPNYMIPAGTNVSITFEVDMTDAADAAVQALPFDATTDTVYWIAEQPSFTLSQGWIDTDEMRVLELTDPDGDMVYSGTLDVTSPAWNGFEYRYAYASPTNGYQSEPSGFGSFAYRVRYIEQNGYQKFVQPFTAPQDHWTAQEDKSDQWEEAPVGDITAVGDNEITPLKFQLSQNYPNPFNPSTAIKFTVASAGQVTLKIFNVLGQQVSTLINKEMNAGNYNFNFDASALSSGIYFYTLRAGKNVATKKMVLLK